jgi:hypothetical protein
VDAKMNDMEVKKSATSITKGCVLKKEDIGYLVAEEKLPIS